MPHRKLTPALALSILAALVACAPAHAGPNSRSSAVVALGDSFISGEGGSWQGNSSSLRASHDGTDRAAYACDEGGCEHDPALIYGRSYGNRCDRSDLAPIKSSGIDVDVRFNLACSGAKTSNLWRGARGGEALRGERPQADQLRRVARARDVRALVVTVGANDFGFGGLVAGCAALWTATPADHPVKCAPAAQQRLERARKRVSRHVAKTLRELRAVMSRSGYRRRQYRLLVMGYASPIPPGSHFRYRQRGWARLTRGQCPFWSSDASWAIHRATPYINHTLRSTAREAGGTFLDISHALDGHQLCDRASKRATPKRAPSESGSEWVRQLDPGCCQGRVRESLHPNAYGQRELGRCVSLAYARPRDERDLGCDRTAATIASTYVLPGG